MAQNKAAWILESKGHPLKVEHADSPIPESGEIVVKNHAVAICPADNLVQSLGMFIERFPNIPGGDVAGEVVAVGSNVKGFKEGDRVMGFVQGFGTQRPENGAFQLYSAVHVSTASRIPDSLSFTQASVLPLAISTAAAGLYQKGFLELPLPILSLSPRPSGQIILIWGGSSTVGISGIQLAVGSGVEVISTASPRNHTLVQQLGASQVFDYNSSSVIEDIVATIKASGKQFAGVLDCISTAQSIESSASIERLLDGSKTIAVVHPPPENARKDINFAGIFALSIAYQFPAVAEHVWGKWVPAALAADRLKALPQALVIGKGLESVQVGMDRLKEGVSAAKIVVELQDYPSEKPTLS